MKHRLYVIGAVLAVALLCLATGQRDDVRGEAKDVERTNHPAPRPISKTPLAKADPQAGTDARQEQRRFATESVAKSELVDRLRKSNGAALAPSQLEGLGNAYAKICAERLDYEVSIAKVSTIPSNGARLIEIPSYPKVGSNLRKKLAATFEEILGPRAGAQVLQQVQVFVSANNADWGAYPQQYLIVYNADKDTYTVDHTMDPGELRRVSGGEISPELVFLYEKWLPFFPERR